MRAVNRSHNQMRAVGERAPATLKNWRVLRRYRGCPTRITNLAAAILALHLQPTT